jgi:molecular chaperone IbpA
MSNGKLIIRGETKADESNDFLFKGIANRAFTRSFVLNDEIEVKDAEMFNGMLKIFLERLVPEAKKPKKIAVKSKGEKQLLTEGEKDAITQSL